MGTKKNLGLGTQIHGVGVRGQGEKVPGPGSLPIARCKSPLFPGSSPLQIQKMTCLLSLMIKLNRQKSPPESKIKHPETSRT